MGHADVGRLAANLYAKATKRRAKLSSVYLAEFDRALEGARVGNAEPSSSLKVVAGNRHYEGAAAIPDPRSGNWQEANTA